MMWKNKSSRKMRMSIFAKNNLYAVTYQKLSIESIALAFCWLCYGNKRLYGWLSEKTYSPDNISKSNLGYCCFSK